MGDLVFGVLMGSVVIVLLLIMLFSGVSLACSVIKIGLEVLREDKPEYCMAFLCIFMGSALLLIATVALSSVFNVKG